MRPADPRQGAAAPAAGAIVLEAVAKTYFGTEEAVQALAPVSLEVRPGEAVSVVGPSGCGKSTLLRLIAGIDQPSAGRVLVNGRPVTGPLTDVGIVFQRDLLLDWRRVLENVLLPAEIKRLDRAAARARAETLLLELGVADFAGAYPWQLSGGMRQRVAIARALLPNPSMLLLDEPFSALDALTRDQMNVILQQLQLSERVTTLLITHSITEAVFIADRVVVMSGRPGMVLDEIPVPFEKPRRLSLRESPAFTEIMRRIRLQFEKAGVLAA